MSDSFLRLIPKDPQFEPSQEAGEAAARCVNAMMPSTSAVNIRRFSEVHFVDQGANFERVLCPHCHQELTTYWSDCMQACSKNQFSKRIVELPCCKKESDLNALIYEWPAGFARFVLEIQNPDPSNWLVDSAQRNLENILGCEVRQILAHY